MKWLRAVLAVTGLMTAAVRTGWTQEPAPSPTPSATAGGWSFVIQPYFLAPNMTGESGVHGIVADVDASSGDIFSALDFGAMLYLEMGNGTWAYSLDGSYMDLGASATTPLGGVVADMSQGGVLATAYRRISRGVEGTVGLQYNSINASLHGSGPLALVRSDDKSWWDPYLGARLTWPGQAKWRLAFTGAVGGFGAGSDFAWQVYPQVGYRFSRLFELNGAYRALYMDFKDGEGSEEFVYRVTTHGPQLAAAFHF